MWRRGLTPGFATDATRLPCIAASGHPSLPVGFRPARRLKQTDIALGVFPAWYVNYVSSRIDEVACPPKAGAANLKEI
jgi:hypothetical protein